MSLSLSSTGLLECLPGISGGDVGLYLVDASGVLIQRFGFDDGLDSVALATDVESALAPDRRSDERTMGTEGERVVVTFPIKLAGFDTFLDYVFLTLSEKDQLELDMESMYSSSLALLEELSMVADVMGRLSAAKTEEEVVRVGLEAMMVAESVGRAMYFRYNPAGDRCENVVHLVMNEESRKPVDAEIGNASVPAKEGLLGDVLAGNTDPIIREVPHGQRLGAPDSPEHLAERETLAAPVLYGNEGDTVRLGVILVMDKNATSYSNVVTFGSQESKIVSTIASMIGSTIGNRLIAEFGRELELGREIQQQILPARPVRIAGYDIAGRCETSGSVGGDYFDYLPMGDDRTLAVVADVSGHNLASGMLMVSARSTLKLLASRHQAPGPVFDDLLDSLFDDLKRTEQFITAVGVAIGSRSDCLEIVNAGHNDTLVYRAGTGAIERLPSTDTILGFIPSVKFRTARTGFGPGDVAFLFTDGITEAQDGAGEMYGESRLERVLHEHATDSAARILDAVFDSVESFIGAVEKPDDMTAVVIKREPHS